MEEYAPGYSNDDLLVLYMLTGGVPKYVELFCDNDRLTVEKMYRFVFSEMSPFLERRTQFADHGVWEKLRYIFFRFFKNCQTGIARKVK